MIKYFKESIGLIKKSILKILLFEFIFTLITLIFVVPLFGYVFNGSIKLAGLKYLTSYNIVKFAQSPTTWVVVLFLLVALVFYLLIETSAIIHCFSNEMENKSVSWKEMFKVGFKSAKEVFKGKNTGILLYITACMPFTQLLIVSGIFSYIGIPNFLSYYITQKWIVFAIYLAVVILSLVLNGRWIYTAHGYVLLHYNFKKSRKESHLLSQKERIKNAVYLLLWNIFAYLVFFILILLIFVMPVTIIQKVVAGGYASKIILLSIKAVFKGVILIVSLLSVPLNYAFITVRYFDKRSELNLKKIPEKNDKERYWFKLKKMRGIGYALICLFVIVNGVFFKTGGFSSMNFTLFSTPQISAHRGYSSVAPENTEPAFQAAIDCGADYIELDVQETEDGEIIVMHDSNLYRTSGIDKNIWEVTYNQIENIDVGCWFSDEFKDTKIMKLEDVLKLTKGKIKLNIEIKLTGHENLIVEKTAALISEYEFEDSCYVTSFSYDLIRKMKQINPNIKTALIMSVAYGNVGSMEYADAVSVNQMFVTKRLVSTCHNNGKKVFVWTADKYSDIQRLTELNVDNIITDYPEKALKVTYKVYTGNTIFSVLKFLSN